MSCGSEHVTLHVPSTAETKDLINEELLMKMPKDATLIHTARRERVHEARERHGLSSRLRCAAQGCRGNQGARRPQIHEARHLHQEEERRKQTIESSRFVYSKVQTFGNPRQLDPSIRTAR